MEIWKDIKGYEGLYQVSNLGRVKRLLKTKPNRILKPVTGRDGYLQISLSKQNHYHTQRIHRLVASAFIENPNHYPVVNHKDEDVTNNAAENLEWCTVQYNTRYRDAHLRRTESLKKAVCQIALDGKFIKVWDSAAEAARALGIERSCISSCCLHYPHFKTAGGYIWEFE